MGVSPTASFKATLFFLLQMRKSLSLLGLGILVLFLLAIAKPPILVKSQSDYDWAISAYCDFTNIGGFAIASRNSTKIPNPRRLRDFLICRRKKRVALKEA